MFRDYVDWPKNERIPESIEQALALGWKVTGNSCEVSEDELTQVGTADLIKTIGALELQLDIPFRAEIIYAQPANPKAVLEINEDEIADRNWAANARFVG